MEPPSVSNLTGGYIAGPGGTFQGKTKQYGHPCGDAINNEQPQERRTGALKTR